MESPNNGASPVSHGGGSRPSLGFPLGTALLLVVIFSLSGIFSCCYHWDKLRRSLSLPAADLEAGGDPGLAKPINPQMKLKQQENQSLPVIMPGDNIARFIALPCPCEPLRLGKIEADLQKPPLKPPRMAVRPVPLY